MNSILECIGRGGGDKNLIRTSDEFNIAMKHAFSLLEEGALVYINGGFSTAIFLSITALEEIAKIHYGVYTSGSFKESGRGNNHFYKHGSKHKMAAMDTMRMSKRLEDAIGGEAIKKIQKMAISGGLIKLREQALYFERRSEALETPRLLFDSSCAREILLYSIELFDDALVGMTTCSMKILDDVDRLFDKIK